MKEEELFYYIEAYLAGELSPDEKLVFEARLSSDNSFKKEFDKHKLAEAIIETNYAANLSAIIKQKQSQAKKKKKTRNTILAVSGLAILMVGGVYLKESNNSSKTPKVIGLKEKKHEYNEVNVTSKENDVLDSKKVQTVPKSRTVDLEPKIKLEQIKSQTHEKNSSKANDKGISKELSEEIDLIEESNDSGLVQKDLVDTSKVIEGLKEQFEVKDLSKNQEQLLECPPFSPEIEVVHASLRQSDGQLIFRETEDVLYKVGETDVFEELSELSYLEVGKYQIQAKKIDGCEYDIGIYEIKQLPCAKKQSFTFNIEFEQRIVIPMKRNSKSNITIFDSNGRLVFEEDVYEAEEFEWNGNLSNGAQAGIDTYLLIVDKDENDRCEYDVVVAK